MLHSGGGGGGEHPLRRSNNRWPCPSSFLVHLMKGHGSLPRFFAQTGGVEWGLSCLVSEDFWRSDTNLPASQLDLPLTVHLMFSCLSHRHGRAFRCPESMIFPSILEAFHSAERPLVLSEKILKLLGLHVNATAVVLGVLRASPRAPRVSTQPDSILLGDRLTPTGCLSVLPPVHE